MNPTITDIDALRMENMKVSYNISNYATEKLNGSSNFMTWSFTIKTQLELDDLWCCIERDENVIDVAKNRKYKIILSVKIRGEVTAKNVCTKLNNMFKDTGLKRRITLLQKTTSTSFQLGEIGFAISDEWLASLMSKGLPLEYRPMIMTLSCIYRYI
uniref:DUF4219 domain-containing protein n=1 Tax=Megaselia scalaris TaxID=36166 RepID=T1GA37_MEGSC